MKKLTAFLIALSVALCLSAAQAASWPVGRSPAQPYEGVPAVDLSKELGYIMLYPRNRMPAKNFCDRLEMFLPRNDVHPGDGTLRLYTEKGELVIETSFQDADRVIQRPLTEEEMTGFMWGGGTCFEIRLPVSLKLNQGYYVDMDKACIVSNDGACVSPPVHAKDAWMPTVTGDYGVSSLSYTPAPPAPEQPEAAPEQADAAPEQPEAAPEQADAAPEQPEAAPEQAETAPEQPEAATEQPEAGPEQAETASAHAVGDTFTFDLTLGGDATLAVIYSENDSVDISELEYAESGPITGTVTAESPKWSVIFLNEAGDILRIVHCCR